MTLSRSRAIFVRLSKRRKIPPPMVNEEAARRFLSQQFDSHDWIKEVPRGELLDAARKLGYRFATEPWNNQLACFLLGAHFPTFLFFIKVGGGKSKIVLDLMRHRKREGELRRALILAPKEVHLASWEDEIRTHAPDLSYRFLLGTKAQRFRELERGSDVCFSLYKGLQSFMSEHDEEEGELKVDSSSALAFAQRFNYVEFDESHNIGNPEALVVKMCRWLAAAAQFKNLTTGTPFGRDPTRLFTQYSIADGGETLGRTLGLFRNTFFVPKSNRYATSGYEWEFNPKMTGELHRVIKHRSITYEARELHDLPPKLNIRLPCRMSEEQRGYYERIIEGVREARGDYQSLNSAFIRMRQCASGYVSLRADDDSRIQFAFKENPKLESLRDFLLSREEKILVYHEFRISADLIEAMLRASHIDFVALRGGVADPAGAYRQFLQDKRKRVFLLQNQTGSEAINPQRVSRRIVFYEGPTDPIIRQQAEGRIERPGQEERMFVHDLVMLGTVEEKLTKYVRDGRDLLKAVLSGEASFERDEK